MTTERKQKLIALTSKLGKLSQNLWDIHYQELEQDDDDDAQNLGEIAFLLEDVTEKLREAADRPEKEEDCERHVPEGNNHYW